MISLTQLLLSLDFLSCTQFRGSSINANRHVLEAERVANFMNFRFGFVQMRVEFGTLEGLSIA